MIFNIALLLVVFKLHRSSERVKRSGAKLSRYVCLIRASFYRMSTETNPCKIVPLSGVLGTQKLR